MESKLNKSIKLMVLTIITSLVVGIFISSIKDCSLSKVFFFEGILIFSGCLLILTYDEPNSNKIFRFNYLNTYVPDYTEVKLSNSQKDTWIESSIVWPILLSSLILIFIGIL